MHSINKKRKDIIGGQLFACQSIVSSSLLLKYKFIKIDSTQRSIPAPHIAVRLFDAISRIVKFILTLIFKPIDVVLIFVADGPSFLEKGVMVMIASFFKKPVILFPRSGLIVNDVKNENFVSFLKKVLRNTKVLIVQGNLWKDFYSKFRDEVKPEIEVQQNWLNLDIYFK